MIGLVNQLVNFEKEDYLKTFKEIENVEWEIKKG